MEKSCIIKTEEDYIVEEKPNGSLKTSMLSVDKKEISIEEEKDFIVKNEPVQENLIKGELEDFVKEEPEFVKEPVYFNDHCEEMFVKDGLDSFNDHCGKDLIAIKKCNGEESAHCADAKGSDTGDVQSMCSSCSEKLSPTQQPKRMKKENKQNMVLDLVAERLHQQEGKYDKFATYIANELQDLPENTSTLAMKLINDVIFHAKLGNLNANSTIINNLINVLPSSTPTSAVFSPQEGAVASD